MIGCLPTPFCRDDFQSELLPAYADMDRALREGSFPLLSPYSWFGGNLAGEYQYGVFSVVHLLIIAVVFRLGLSLAHTAAAISVVYMVIAASGAFRLGRRYGLGMPAALIVSMNCCCSDTGYGDDTASGYLFPLRQNRSRSLLRPNPQRLHLPVQVTPLQA